MIYIVVVFILILMTGFTILFNLRSTGNVLIDVGRELDTLAQNLDQQLSDAYLPDSNRFLPEFNSNGNVSVSSLEEKDGTWNPVAASPGTDILKQNVLTKLKDYLKNKQTKTAAESKDDPFAASLVNNSDLKQRIMDLVGGADTSISLQHLVKNLSKQYFDGNYHPVLNELDRLEREGEIEGRVINGKVFFTKRHKETRKYTIRKGKNFRKYMG